MTYHQLEMKTEKEGGKKNQTQAPSWTGWHIRAHPWRWGLAVCPTRTHIFTSLVSCWHCNIHTSSISGTESLQLKWYPSLENQSQRISGLKYQLPQKCLRVSMRAWETVGVVPALHVLQTKPGGVLRLKFHLCYPGVHTWFLSSFPSHAVAATASCPVPAVITKSGKQWSRQRGGSSSGGEVREASSDVFARPLMVSRPQCEEPGKTAHSSKKLMQLPNWK